MKTTKIIKKTTDKQELENDYFEKIINGSKITEEVDIEGRGKFTIAFPLPSDLNAIEVDVAKMLEGQPIESFSKITVGNFRVYATLDKLVKGPKWWENLESSDRCPDSKVIEILYRRYLRFYNKVSSSIENSRLDSDIGKLKTKNEDEVVDNGTFSDVAYGPEI